MWCTPRAVPDSAEAFGTMKRTLNEPEDGTTTAVLDPATPANVIELALMVAPGKRFVPDTVTFSDAVREYPNGYVTVIWGAVMLTIPVAE